jgi:C4-dicarboxylate transporter DctM subunit
MPMMKIGKAIRPYLLGLIVAFFLVMYVPMFIPGLIVG